MITMATIKSSLQRFGKRPLFSEPGSAWSAEDICRWANDVARAARQDPACLVPVAVQSPAFAVSSLLGLWSVGKAPLLLDSLLISEFQSRAYRETGDMILTEQEAPLGNNTMHIRRHGRAPLSLTFPGDDELAIAFLTSGSTGNPKLVSKKTFQLVNQMRVEPRMLGLDGPLSVVSLVPPFHILGFLYGILLPLLLEGEALFCPRSAPHGWVKAIRSTKPDLVVGVPAHYRLLAGAAEGPLPGSLYICSGGPLDPLCAAEFERVSDQSITQIYGSTETGGVALRRGERAWTAFPSLSWRIRDGRSEGPLEIRSPWQEVPNEWTATGDYARHEGAGFQLLGRVDSVVKIGGRRLSLLEVEDTALRHPQIEQAVALAYERYTEHAIALFVCPVAGETITAGGIRAFLASCLTAYKVPRTIRIVDSIPLKGIGKTDLDQLLKSLR